MDTPDIHNEETPAAEVSKVDAAADPRLEVERLPVRGGLAGRMKSLFLIG